MLKIKISEIFGPVLQGEGLYAGTPSVFVRTFGCNFRCKMFGVPSSEEALVDAKLSALFERIPLFKKLEDIPQVSFGCDTPYAIYKEFNKFTTTISIEELAEQINSKISDIAISCGMRQPHLVFTGGEPLLWDRQFCELFPLLSNKFTHITFETNATQTITPKFQKVLSSCGSRILFSCSPKLTCSGHTFSQTFVPDAIRSYNNVSNSRTVLKFVVGSEQSIQEVKKFIKNYYLEYLDIFEVFLMPEGCLFDDRYKENCKRVSQLCLENGYRYSPRLQVELWNNGSGT